MFERSKIEVLSVTIVIDDDHQAFVVQNSEKHIHFVRRLEMYQLSGLQYGTCFADVQQTFREIEDVTCLSTSSLP